jgi:hypothetical protein
MANNDPLGLFEDERDPETGDLVLSEVGERFGEVIRESMKDIVDDRMGAMVEAVDQYFQEDVTDHVNDLVEDNVAEIRKLMLLAISTISGSEKTREFIRKVAELARAGALSSATGAWAQGGPPDASTNRDSVRGGGISTRKESVDDEIEEAREIFYEAVADMDEDGKALMMSLCGDIEYSGDAGRLRREIELVRNQQVPSPLTEAYTRAISRTVRR